MPARARASTSRSRYGATTALDRVSVDVRAGEIHAVVGENGAGKSTLLRVLAGAEAPHQGGVQRPVGVRVAWVPQDAELPADFTASEWIFLGAERRGRVGWLRRRAMDEESAALLGRVGCRVRSTMRVGALAATQRKQVQLARALREDAHVWLLDEPTAVLGGAETARLFDLARDAARAGAAVVYVRRVVGINGRIAIIPRYRTFPAASPLTL